MRRATAALSFWLAWCCYGEAQALQLSCEPYLQGGDATGVTIAWRTDEPSASAVYFGEAPTALTKVATNNARVRRHAIRISHLQPSTRYYYAVGIPDGILHATAESFSFRTAPAANTTDPLRLWVVGDSGTGGPSQLLVYAAMQSSASTRLPDLFLHVGDMAYDNGTNLEFQARFFDIYAETLRNTVVWPALGNHEGHSSESSTQRGPYFDVFHLPAHGEQGGLPSGTEAYYSFDWGDTHFVVLDSHQSNRSTSGAMLNWMLADLESTDRRWLIAYWHHPPYTKGTHDSDDEQRHVEMRENALPILEAAGVDLVLGGHSHSYERSRLVHGAYDTPTTASGHIVDTGGGHPLSDGPYDGVGPGTVYIVAGHGGAHLGGPLDHPLMLVDELIHGSCIIDIDRNVLRLTNVHYTGARADSFTMVKGDALFVIDPDSDTLRSGATANVRWYSTDNARVDLDASFDDGLSWEPVAANATSPFSWRAPAIASRWVRLRVTSAHNSAATDTNDAPLRIEASGAPELLPLAPVAVLASEELRLEISAAGAAELGLLFAPSGAAVVDTTLTWTPQATDVGRHRISVFADSGTGRRAVEVVDVAVLPAGTELLSPSLIAADGCACGNTPRASWLWAVLLGLVRSRRIRLRGVRATFR